LEYRPWAREVEIAYALKPGQTGNDLARRLTLSGLSEAPRVILNGRRAEVTGTAPLFHIALSP
jgi:hypothetical protein